MCLLMVFTFLHYSRRRRRRQRRHDEVVPTFLQWIASGSTFTLAQRPRQRAASILMNGTTKSARSNSVHCGGKCPSVRRRGEGDLLSRFFRCFREAPPRSFGKWPVIGVRCRVMWRFRWWPTTDYWCEASFDSPRVERICR